MSWSSVKTEAVVLHVYPFREADRIYHILTPQYGKLRVMGRGAQKEKAKLAGQLEPFSIVSVEIIQGRRSTTIISVDQMHRFDAFRVVLERRLLVQTACALIDRYTQDGQHDETLYQQFIDWLHFLDVSKDLSNARATFYLASFLLKFMSHLGYEVQLEHCLVCREPVLPLSFRWHGGKGGLICTDCARKDEREWFAAERVDEAVLTLLRMAKAQRYNELAQVALSKDHLEAVARMVHDLMMLHLPGLERGPFWEGLMIDIPLERPIQTR